MLRTLSRRSLPGRSRLLTSIKQRSTSTFTSSQPSSRGDISNLAINELKKITAQAASDETIKLPGRRAKTPQLDHDELLAGTYSSSYDGILRQTNTGEILRLWSLLEVCLESEQYERALTILDTLNPLAKEDRLEFVDDLNRYLQKWSQKASLKELQKFVSKWEDKYDVTPNAKTLSILVSSTLNAGNDPVPLLDPYVSNGGNLRWVFSNLEVLGVKNLAKLVDDYKYDINLIPEEYRNLIESYSTEKKKAAQGDQSPCESEVDTFDGITDLPPSLANGATNLKPVDTFGMKVIRHTLMGLKPHLNDKLIENLDGGLTEKFDFLMTEQKGGMNFFEIYRSLPENLQEEFESALDDFNQQRQRQLENRAILAAQERWKHDYEELKSKGSLSLSKNLNATLWKWSQGFLPLIEEEIQLCQSIDQVDTSKLNKAQLAQHRERAKYAPFFNLLPAKKMSAITILELLKLNSTNGVVEGMRTARAVVAVSNALELEFRSEQLLKSENVVFKDMKNTNNLKKYAQSLTAFKSDKLSDWKFIWPHDIKVKIGSLLISILMHVATVKVEGVDPITKKKVFGEAPAFYHSYQYQNSVKVGILKIHRSIGSQLSADSLVGTVQPQLLPMLVKPRPWTSWNKGGYLYSQGYLIRSRDAPEQMAYLKASSDKLDQVYKGLNVLGETAWTVNERVFKIMTHYWNKGEEFLDIPPVVDELTLPERPPRNADPSEIFEWKKKCEKLTNEFNNNRSVRCDSNYKLEIARAFLGEKMYFPHNLDFRGRAYPLSPNLNHLGNDLSRGLLIFWQGKKLGPHGLNWLKVHLSNLFGIDKAPLHERIDFTNSNIDKIFKTAEDPIAYSEWWVSADKPWQALATIYELADALRHPNPEEFISRQPVHQDGTCNGLQHYAALGGDVEGAKQVNLAPAERPQDVYTYVANLVIKRLEKAAAEGDEYAQILKSKIKRKIVKQTVMTNVYGVTYIGATAQIDKQLADVFPGEDTYLYSVYLTKHVFACIRELFEGAHLIQDWLAVCAKLISSSVRIDLDSRQLSKGDAPPFMSSVIWTTPLNLPIVQPYRAVKRKQISTNLQTIFISDPFAMNPVDPRKQMAAFPPNYIHSLDATHMLMSAVACHDAGIQFASVHDSYWTHAGDVDIMNEKLRNEFIKLHEVDLIQSLKEEFDQRYRGFLRIVKIPKSSEFAKRVLEKRKELSKELNRKVTFSDEIFLERKRQTLLNSENPEEIQQGREMVTTVSLLESEDFDAITKQVSKKRGRKSKADKELAEIQKAEEMRLTEEVDMLGEEIDGVSGIQASGEVEEETVQKKKSNTEIRILAPLRLPEIPPKGEFDVQELRNSQYFFS